MNSICLRVVIISLAVFCGFLPIAYPEWAQQLSYYYGYVPTIVTADITSITISTAKGGGSVISGGELRILGKGVCWSTSPNPNISDNATMDGHGVGSFTSSITGLSPGTTYHVRAYAIYPVAAYATYSASTSYGNELVFTTSKTVPTVTTTAISSVTSTGVSCGGNVTSDGGASVTARGVCWSTSSHPTISDSHTLDGSGTGSFNSSITGLLPGTTYHARAYATNSEGTTYGAERTFFTLVADILIQKSVDKLNPDVGEYVVFIVKVTNSGPSDATGLQVTDILPSGLYYVSDSSMGTYDSFTGIWNINTLSATVPDNTVSLYITATVIQEGESLNIATVSSCDVVDLDSSNNSSALVLNGGNQADLAIIKNVENQTPFIGETVTFTIKVTNNGLNNATGIEVTDVLPTGLTYLASVPSRGSYDSDTGVWDIGDLETGKKVTLDLTAGIYSEDEIVNTAAITHIDQTDPDITNNSASSVLNQDMASHPFLVDLAVLKGVNRSEVNIGDQVVFTLVVRNNGLENADNVEIYDLLPAGLTFESSDPFQGFYDEQTGIWNVGSIPSGCYVLMDMVVVSTVAQPLINTASVYSIEGHDIDTTNDSSSASVTGLSKFGPDIKANGQDGPVTVSSGIPVSVTVGLDPGDYASANADWWIAVRTPLTAPYDWYTYTHPSGWGLGVNLCAQMPLFAFSDFEVLDDMVLSPGGYTFYFALDPPDGVPTANLVDSVEVIVQQFDE